MKNLLAIDIGNTNITLGIFFGARLIKKTKIPTADDALYKRRLIRFLNKRDIEGAIISSVVPKALSGLKRVLRKARPHSKILVLGEGLKAPIKNLYKVKREVGQDRLVNAVAAKIIYGAPALVIDFGTAITFDVVSRQGAYLGGLILPGIELSLQSLYEKTALLPKVALKPTRQLIGKGTRDSIRGGILFGFGAMCDSLISKYRKMFGN
ncbi:MAG: type III pantothenate kinase, partial [Candidatus Omnitrophota bacterium]|nr:type III pantothenate kinase [Candidatus Omnitrophota bacterium]